MMLSIGFASRVDASYVGLYTTGAETHQYNRGVVRFFNVKELPPRRGRPPVVNTLSLSDFVDQVVNTALFSLDSEWGEAEPD